MTYREDLTNQIYELNCDLAGQKATYHYHPAHLKEWWWNKMKHDEGRLRVMKRALTPDILDRVVGKEV